MASDTDALQFWLFRLSSSLVSSCPKNISRKSERLISLLKRPGRDLSELFSDAADATTNVMIDNIEAIQPRETRQIELSNDKLDMLLFDLLQELIFLKDAERLLLRMRQLEIEEKDKRLFLRGIAEGEPLDVERHHQRADVKAVTLHDFSVEPTESGWKARVLLDI